MPSISEIDITVSNIRADIAHVWVAFTNSDGYSLPVCDRCGRLKAELEADGVTRPCKGFPD